MTAQELKKIETDIKFDAESMAVCLGLTTHCYRKYIYEENPIPERVARAALELVQIQKTFDIQRDLDYCAFLNAKYPQGFGEKVVLKPEPLHLS